MEEYEALLLPQKRVLLTPCDTDRDAI